MQPAL